MYAKELTDAATLDSSDITFWSLWTLFPPHALVIGHDTLNQLRAYRTKTTKYAKQQDGSWAFQIKFDYIDTDGNRTGWVKPQNAEIPEFQDMEKIDSLPMVPLDKHPNPDGVRKELKARGEKATRLAGSQIQEYKGVAIGDFNHEIRDFVKFHVSPSRFVQSVH